LHSDAPDRFRQGLKLLALAENGDRRQLEVEDLWPHQEFLVLKFRDVDSISAAEALLGCELQVPREHRARLDPGWTYVSELQGCTVIDGDREIGKVEDVRLGAGEAPLLIVKTEKRELEIPYAEAYLKRVDLAAQQIYMLLPDGMLELDAPLTAEEKQQQKRSSG
jgi:16S rRNA processing protein RimM